VQGCNLLVPERREKARERQKQVKKKDGSAVEVKMQLITKKKIQEGDEKMTIATKRAAKRQARNHER
jgi:hypothetical protein